jgi:hypothetical protein
LILHIGNDDILLRIDDNTTRITELIQCGASRACAGHSLANFRILFPELNALVIPISDIDILIFVGKGIIGPDSFPGRTIRLRKGTVGVDAEIRTVQPLK